MRKLATVLMAALAVGFVTACTSQGEPNTLASQSPASETTTTYIDDPYSMDSEDVFYYDPRPEPECYAEGSIMTDGEVREIGDGAIAYGYNNHLGFGGVSEEPMSYMLLMYPDVAYDDFITVEIAPTGHGGWAVSAPFVFAPDYLSEDLDRFYFHGSMQEDGSGGSFEATFVSESSGQEVEVIIDWLSCVK